MITELIVNALVAVVNALAGLFPQIDTPAWVTNLSTHVDFVVSKMAPLGVWLPFGAAGNALLFVLAAVAAAVVIKVVRIVSSYATLGGGAAG